MLALTLLGVLVAADGSGEVTAAIFTTGLPERLLQDLADTPHQVFFQVSQRVCMSAFVLSTKYCKCSRGDSCVLIKDDMQVGAKVQSVVHVMVSQAAVLLELMRSTLGLVSQPAGGLMACTTILSKMTACQVL